MRPDLSVPGEANVAPAVEPRCGFLPPCYFIPARGQGLQADWPTGGAIVPLLDLAGERPAAGDTRIELSYDSHAIHLLAQGRDAALTLRPELPPDDPRFWTQDHVEFRLLTRAGEHLQVIAALDGRCWCSREANIPGGGPVCRATLQDGAWRLDLALPATALGYAELREGMVLEGIVACTRWRGERADIACCSATELGFSQRERFARFVLRAKDNAPALTGFHPIDAHLARLTVANPKATPFAGWLVTRQEGAAPSEVRRPIELPPRGEAEATVPFTRRARRFTPLHILLEDGPRRCELAAISMRGSLPLLPSPRVQLTHPYLHFDRAGQNEFRRKAALPALRPLASALEPRPEDFDDAYLPPPGGAISFAFDSAAMHWGRVARETMRRDACERREPAAARIWDLLTPEAREAFAAVAVAGHADAGHLQAILPAFNSLLVMPDLYDPAAFSRVRLPGEGIRLLGRGPSTLRGNDLAKFNRILIQSTIECCWKFNVDLAAKAGRYLGPWLLSGDARLVELATRTAQLAAQSMIPEATFHLHEGNLSPMVALAYDTFHPLLSPAQRQSWQDLLTQLLDLYLDSARAGAWTVSTIANANPVANAGAGFLALALWDEEPVKAREAIEHLRANVWRWLDYSFGADGGNTEGCQYWQYAVESWVRFASLYERFFGSDDGMLDHPALRRGMEMIRVALCNDGALHGCNDTIPVPLGGELAWFWSGRYRDRFALWYGDHAQRWFAQAAQAGRAMPYPIDPLWGILFRPDEPEIFEQPEPLPRALALRSIECAILRSGPAWDCRWTAGIKGARPPYTHHNQPDAGAFFADLRGQRMLIDPGYYKGSPTDHSLPLIGTVAPAAASDWTGKILACAHRDDLCWLACDTTLAYRGAAARVRRWLVLVGQEALVLLDDVVPAGAEDASARVLTQFQCGGPTRALPGDGRSIAVTAPGASLRLDVLTHAGMRLDLHPERDLHDTHWGYHFANCRLFPVSGAYRASRDEPLLATFQDATDRSPASPVVIRTPDRIELTFDTGSRLAFFAGPDGWQLHEALS